MIYKTFLFVAAFTLLLGVNKSNAQCECIEEITVAVENVMATNLCDDVWEAPHALEVHLAKLQNWCGDMIKPLKSKVPNIVNGMLETIDEAITGYTYIDPVTLLPVEVPPAPECALDELLALQDLLLYGCL